MLSQFLDFPETFTTTETIESSNIAKFRSGWKYIGHQNLLN